MAQTSDLMEIINTFIEKKIIAAGNTYEVVFVDDQKIFVQIYRERLGPC